MIIAQREGVRKKHFLVRSSLFILLSSLPNPGSAPMALHLNSLIIGIALRTDRDHFTQESRSIQRPVMNMHSYAVLALRAAFCICTLSVAQIKCTSRLVHARVLIRTQNSMDAHLCSCLLAALATRREMSGSRVYMATHSWLSERLHSPPSVCTLLAIAERAPLAWS